MDASEDIFQLLLTVVPAGAEVSAQVARLRDNLSSLELLLRGFSPSAPPRVLSNAQGTCRDLLHAIRREVCDSSETQIRTIQPALCSALIEIALLPGGRMEHLLPALLQCAATMPQFHGYFETVVSSRLQTIAEVLFADFSTGTLAVVQAAVSLAPCRPVVSAALVARALLLLEQWMPLAALHRRDSLSAASSPSGPSSMPLFQIEEENWTHCFFRAIHAIFAAGKHHLSGVLAERRSSADALSNWIWTNILQSRCFSDLPPYQGAASVFADLASEPLRAIALRIADVAFRSASDEAKTAIFRCVYALATSTGPADQHVVASTIQTCGAYAAMLANDLAATFGSASMLRKITVCICARDFVSFLAGTVPPSQALPRREKKEKRDHGSKGSLAIPQELVASVKDCIVALQDSLFGVVWCDPSPKISSLIDNVFQSWVVVAAHFFPDLIEPLRRNVVFRLSWHTTRKYMALICLLKTPLSSNSSSNSNSNSTDGLVETIPFFEIFRTVIFRLPIQHPLWCSVAELMVTALGRARSAAARQVAVVRMLVSMTADAFVSHPCGASLALSVRRIFLHALIGADPEWVRPLLDAALDMPHASLRMVLSTVSCYRSIASKKTQNAALEELCESAFRSACAIEDPATSLDDQIRIDMLEYRFGNLPSVEDVLASEHVEVDGQLTSEQHQQRLMDRACEAMDFFLSFVTLNVKTSNSNFRHDLETLSVKYLDRIRALGFQAAVKKTFRGCFGGKQFQEHVELFWRRLSMCISAGFLPEASSYRRMGSFCLLSSIQKTMVDSSSYLFLVEQVIYSKTTCQLMVYWLLRDTFDRMAQQSFDFLLSVPDSLFQDRVLGLLGGTYDVAAQFARMNVTHIRSEKNLGSARLMYLLASKCGQDGRAIAEDACRGILRRLVLIKKDVREAPQLVCEGYYALVRLFVASSPLAVVLKPRLLEIVGESFEVAVQILGWSNSDVDCRGHYVISHNGSYLSPDGPQEVGGVTFGADETVYNEESGIIVSVWKLARDAGQLVSAMPSSWFSEDDLQFICSKFIQALLGTKHIGIVERTHFELLELCRRSPDALVRRWLSALMDDILSMAEMAGSNSFLRRSSGVPYALLAILKGGGNSSNNNSSSNISSSNISSNNSYDSLIDLVMPQLLAMAAFRSDAGPSALIRRVHGLNLIRALLADAVVGMRLEKYVPQVLMLVFEGFRSLEWAIRNSCFMCYAAFVLRFVGDVKASAGEVSSKMNIEEIFQRYPSLFAFIVEELRGSKERMGRFVTPILTLLSRLAPTLHRNPYASTLLPLVQQLPLTQFGRNGGSDGPEASGAASRRMAALATFSLISIQDIPSFVQSTLLSFRDVAAAAGQQHNDIGYRVCALVECGRLMRMHLTVEDMQALVTSLWSAHFPALLGPELAARLVDRWCPWNLSLLLEFMRESLDLLDVAEKPDRQQLDAEAMLACLCRNIFWKVLRSNAVGGSSYGDDNDDRAMLSTVNAGASTFGLAKLQAESVRLYFGLLRFAVHPEDYAAFSRSLVEWSLNKSGNVDIQLACAEWFRAPATSQPRFRQELSRFHPHVQAMIRQAEAKVSSLDEDGAVEDWVEQAADEQNAEDIRVTAARSLLHHLLVRERSSPRLQLCLLTLVQDEADIVRRIACDAAWNCRAAEGLRSSSSASTPRFEQFLLAKMVPQFLSADAARLILSQYLIPFPAVAATATAAAAAENVDEDGSLSKEGVLVYPKERGNMFRERMLEIHAACRWLQRQIDSEPPMLSAAWILQLLDVSMETTHSAIIHVTAAAAAAEAGLDERVSRILLMDETCFLRVLACVGVLCVCDGRNSVCEARRFATAITMLQDARMLLPHWEQASAAMNDASPPNVSVLDLLFLLP